VSLFGLSGLPTGEEAAPYYFKYIDRLPVEHHVAILRERYREASR